MSTIMKLWLVLVLTITWLAFGPGSHSCLAEPPGPPHKTGPWQPVKGVHGVEYAPDLPDLPGDLFRYGKKYYYFYEGDWSQGDTYRGPWKRVEKIPPIFREIGPEYYKSPPGWSRGKKTGWGGASMPPGQMKKHHFPGWSKGKKTGWGRTQPDQQKRPGPPKKLKKHK
ncbi:MAG: hypothetical protein ACLFUU_10400 [Desulfobacteraceae bacterium]